MKKILFMLAITLSFLSALNVQKATKDELMCIKGIGEKKSSALMKYRKSHKLKSAQDLLEIKGFGKVLVKNVEKDIKSVACGDKKSSKKVTKATKKLTKKKSSDTKSSKKSTKKESTQSDKATKVTKKSTKKKSANKKKNSDTKSSKESAKKKTIKKED